MSAPIVIANARIVDPASNSDRKGALLIADDKVEGLAEGAPQGVPDEAVLIDASDGDHVDLSAATTATLYIARLTAKPHDQ